MKKSIFSYTTLFISISYSLFANASSAIKSKENQTNEVLKVYSTPLHTPQEKMAIPVAVLTQEELRANRSASIAETLTSLPGFHASFFWWRFGTSGYSGNVWKSSQGITQW
ncbi:hypothetical protein [Proteus penneri]|uniref:hypothetical protein n=1 Tax=Proteus penneri TaxID=102862 RepID=UPI001E63DF65|nr:hypothetical protein [Proteus penneri]